MAMTSQMYHILWWLFWRKGMSACSENLSDASSRLLLYCWVWLKHIHNSISSMHQGMSVQNITTWWPLTRSELLDDDCSARGVGRENSLSQLRMCIEYTASQVQEKRAANGLCHSLPCPTSYPDKHPKWTFAHGRVVLM